MYGLASMSQNGLKLSMVYPLELRLSSLLLPPIRRCLRSFGNPITSHNKQETYGG